MKLLEGNLSRISVPPGKRDVLVFDEALPGFGIRKFASGKASFFVKYSIGSQQRKITLGPVVPGVLAEMRRKASDVLARARLNQDVAGEKKAALLKKTATVSGLIPLFLKAKEGAVSASYYAELNRYLNGHWRALHALDVETVTRREIVNRLDEIASEHGKVSADRARAALSGFFAWAMERSYIDLTPVQGITKRAANGSRQRVLSENELVKIWEACRDDDYGRIVRLLILTAQRKTEIGDLEWPEISFGKRQIELPERRTKNKRAHLVPLSPPAMEILKAAPRRDKRVYVFGEGARGFQGWSKAKLKLDARLPDDIAPWTVHDIRRSVVTALNENGFAQPHVIEAIVNHVSGHKAGVAGVYNRSAYADEKRQVLDAWAAHFLAVTDAAR